MKNGALIIFQILSTLFRVLLPRGTRALVAENIALKHQLLVLNRNQKRTTLQTEDRFTLGWCAENLSLNRLAKVAITIKPATILRFHRLLAAKKYQELYSAKQKRKPGPKGPSREVVNAVLEMKRRNPRFGAPRITEQINLAFGLNINKDVVRRILEKHFKPTGDIRGPSWLTFFGHSKDSLWSVDFFRCESATLKSHWVMVVMDQFTRRIVGFAAHAGDLDGVSICNMFNKIKYKQELPRYLSSDNDPLFKFHRWQANMRILEIEEVKTIPHVPISHPFVERLIGTIRREYLDQTLFWNSLDLERKLDHYKDYFNSQRTHSSIGGQVPSKNEGNTVCLSDFRWKQHCRGLFELPELA